MTWGQLFFRLRGAENSDHIDAARQAALAFVAGHQVADIVASARRSTTTPWPTGSGRAPGS